MSEPIEDFRRRTARTRRRRTAVRLVQALFDQADQVELRDLVVDHVLSSAQLSRGSFYRHFATIGALLDHVGGAVGAQINAEMDELFSDVADPAERISLQARYQVRRAVTDPVCARLMLRLLGRDGSVGESARDRAMADFREAVDRGRFTTSDPVVASDLGHGMLTAMLRRATLEGWDARTAEDQVRMMMRAFGLPDPDASEVSMVDLGSLPVEGLRERVLGLCGDLSG